MEDTTNLCYCNCRNLNCITLLVLAEDGGHIHYAHLPCSNAAKGET